MTPTTYDHASECKRLGIPYYAWCCEACADRAGVALQGIGYPGGGWCQVGKHRAPGRTVWLAIDPGHVLPWKAEKRDEAQRRYDMQPLEVRNVIDAEVICGMSFAEAVNFVLDI